MTKKNYVDFSQAYKAIGKTKKQFEKAEVDALTKAGEYASKELKKNVPYWMVKNMLEIIGGSMIKSTLGIILCFLNQQNASH